MTNPQQLLQSAVQHHQSGRLREAEALYRQVLQHQPDHPDAVHFLGVIAQQVGKKDAAVQFMRRSLALNPNNPAFHINYAIILQEQRQYDEALAHCRQAIALRPGFAEAHANVGAVLTSSGKPEEGVGHLRRALALEPRNVKAHYNLADALSKIGNYADAIHEYEQVLALDPDYAKAQFGLGLLRLLQGDFVRGWEGYEWRWQTADPSIPKRSFTQPLWDGSDLSGKTILLYSEQGYGDAIQFIRYLPRVTERDGRVVLESLAGLTPLFRELSGVEQMISWGEPLPAFDVRCPLMTLPKIFATTLNTIPAEVPYLRAPQDRIAFWHDRLAGDSKHKVGLAWSGNPRHTNDRERSIRPAVLAPLREIENVSFYSLQKNEASRAAVSSAVPDLPLRDLSDDIHDFADTAALIQNLDLVVCVDTAVAHLAGALGKRVWLMIPFVPDWRWLLDRSDSPWYPTMRIFRQSRLRDWAGVVAEVAAALRQCIERGPTP